MKKLWLGLLAVLMLIRAEPANAVSWTDLTYYADQIKTMTTTFFTNQTRQINQLPPITLAIGAGALVVVGFGYLALKASKTTPKSDGEKGIVNGIIHTATNQVVGHAPNTPEKSISKVTRTEQSNRVAEMVTTLATQQVDQQADPKKQEIISKLKAQGAKRLL